MERRNEKSKEMKKEMLHPSEQPCVLLQAIVVGVS